jgi:hypothetical protein
MSLFPSTSVAILDAIAGINFVSAFIVLYMMQTVTGEAGFRSRLALLYLAQRAIYIFLVYALFANAVHIYFQAIMPARSDALVEIAFFLSCMVSFMRHRLAPQIPASEKARSWMLPILRPHY